MSVSRMRHRWSPLAFSRHAVPACPFSPPTIHRAINQGTPASVFKVSGPEAEVPMQLPIDGSSEPIPHTVNQIERGNAYLQLMHQQQKSNIDRLSATAKDVKDSQVKYAQEYQEALRKLAARHFDVMSKHSSMHRLLLSHKEMVKKQEARWFTRLFGESCMPTFLSVENANQQFGEHLQYLDIDLRDAMMVVRVDEDSVKNLLNDITAIAQHEEIMTNNLEAVIKMIIHQYNNDMEKMQLEKDIAIMQGLRGKVEELQNEYKAKLDKEIQATDARHATQILNIKQLASQKLKVVSGVAFAAGVFSGGLFIWNYHSEIQSVQSNEEDEWQKTFQKVEKMICEAESNLKQEESKWFNSAATQKARQELQSLRATRSALMEEKARRICPSASSQSQKDTRGDVKSSTISVAYKTEAPVTN